MAHLFPIVQRELHGFMNRQGEVVIEPIYEMVNEFSEGLAAVRGDRKWGFIDAKGKMVIAPQFDEIRDFSEGLATVRIGKRSGFINKKGAWAFEATAQFLIETHSSIFREGLAKVHIKRTVAYVDPSGKPILSFPTTRAQYFSAGLAPVYSSRKWGFINKDGEFAIPANLATQLHL